MQALDSTAKQKIATEPMDATNTLILLQNQYDAQGCTNAAATGSEIVHNL